MAMTTDETKAVFDHHTEALLAGDLEELMKDYAEDAVVVTNLGGVVRGLDAIRAMFSVVADGGGPAGLENSVEHVDGEVAYVTWSAEGIPFGTDSFVIRDGRIVVQTVAMHFG